MKVSDLKIGMILRPTSDCQTFRQVYNGEWLMVQPQATRVFGTRKPESSSFAMYLGTRKDVGDTKTQWSDRFVLFENSVLAVDPAAWRRIEEVA
tara:strand:- start:14371 stop:14652 length:282 start_codon:yes stop_codon:yes gene_type:complete